jgi:hypothetical protein
MSISTTAAPVALAGAGIVLAVLGALVPAG